MSQFEHSTYLSPYTWRYGSEEMRQLWSLVHQRQLWRRIWVALAEAQLMAGLVSAAQVEDLRQHQAEINIPHAHKLEQDLRHDLMAEVHTYAEQCTVGGGIIHLGATSMDIEDNADALRLREALRLILGRLQSVLHKLCDAAEAHAAHVCMAFTHLQPAEPTTVGYRLAFYLQDMLLIHQDIQRLIPSIKGKGFKGAVGTSASYAQLLAQTEVTPHDFEATIMEKLGLPAFEVANQTYPRSQDWQVVNTLAGLAMTLHKFAFDLRLLQSPPLGEWHEPFGKHQIGSSAMPFKRNPINAENMDSLARYVAALPRILWDNAANSLLERTLDDSGNRRTVLPEAFLATDELLRRAERILKGLRIDQQAIDRNLAQYGIFAATERLLMGAVQAGGDRQHLHEVIRQHSLVAWEALRNSQPNPLRESLAQESAFTDLLSTEQITTLLDATQYIGDAAERTRNIIAQARNSLPEA